MIQKIVISSNKYKSLNEQDREKFDLFFKTLMKLSKITKLLFSNGIKEVPYFIVEKFNDDNTNGTFVFRFNLNTKRWQYINYLIEIDNNNFDDVMFDEFNPTISELIEFTNKFAMVNLINSSNKFNVEMIKILKSTEENEYTI